MFVNYLNIYLLSKHGNIDTCVHTRMHLNTYNFCQAFKKPAFFFSSLVYPVGFLFNDLSVIPVGLNISEFHFQRGY